MHNNNALSKCICFLCFFPLLISADQNITLGSTLTAGDESDSPWLSPSGDFAFGFRQVAANGAFLVAIWYNKIPEETVTWSDRDELAQQGSNLQLTDNGFVLKDKGNSILIINTTGGGVAFAAMLDTGNLVLADNNGTTLWQSFDWPTDTILPTQVMRPGTALVSQISETNCSAGRFKLIMQDDGNLVAYTVNWPQHSVEYFAYYGTSTVGSEYQVVFNQSGGLYVTERNETRVFRVFSDSMDPAEDLYIRATLEYDGVFRKYAYSRSSNWTMQEFQPKDICKQMNARNRPSDDTHPGIGGGACGFNGYCQMQYQKPKCECPHGYSFFDEADKLKGCKRDFIAQSCLKDEEDSQRNDQFELQEMLSTQFWGQDYESFEGLSEAACQDSCLSDCLCAAAAIKGEKCLKKAFPLSNGWLGPDVEEKTFIKVRTGNSTATPPGQLGEQVCKKPNGMSHHVRIFLGGSGFLNVLLLALAVFTATFYRRKRKQAPQERRDVVGTSMHNFSYNELQEATDGFKEVIGQGASATVYKGSLDLEGGKIVAVKKLNETVEENQREFECEVQAIARIGHRNLVQLVGFCNEGQHRLLVYEYMSNGSLFDILFQDQRPSWAKRVRFAFETARGLSYLHEECTIQIIHCDIKPQNVLLDESLTARISDFGLAKLLKKDQTHTHTGIRGTKGYVAPEWFKNMPITTKVDVYSYGILLLEIICCRRSFEGEMEDESQKVLADWAFECCKEGRTDKLVEGDNEALRDIEKVKKLVLIALCCTEEDPSHRPSMDEVVQMIKGEIDEFLPRNLPSYFTSMDVTSHKGMKTGV